MRKLCLAVLFMSLMFSCSQQNESNKPQLGDLIKNQCFISDYLVPSTLKMVRAMDGYILEMTGDSYHTWCGEEYEFAEEINYLSELYGDTSYDGYNRPGKHIALAYPIDDITIYCDKNFDAKHPAGKPLDDVVKLNYQSYYNFIQNGYHPYTQNEQHLQDVDSYSLCFNCINADLTKLVSLNYPYNVIAFTSSPETPGEYNFTIEMTTNGETLKTTFTHTFE